MFCSKCIPFDMKLSKVIIIFTLFVASVSTSAQQIKGVVVDGNTKKPLEGVNIYLKNVPYGTVSKDDGVFQLKNNKASDTIFFRYLGYSTKSYALKTFLGQKRDSVFMYPTEERLGEVEVAGRKKMLDIIKAKKLSSMRFALTGFGSTIVDGRIYVIGGDKSYKEDNFNKEYEKLSEMDPTQLSNPVVFSKLFSSHNEAWVAYSGKLQIYDPKTNNWAQSKTKFAKRAYHTISQKDGKIYVIGGKTLAANGAFEYLANTIEVYDIAKDSIMVDNVNPHQASGPLALADGNDILLIGGSTKMLKNGKKEYAKKIHFYNVPSGNWYELGAIPEGMEPNGTMLNNKLYMVNNNGDNSDTTTIFIFDFITGKWDKLPDVDIANHNPRLVAGNGILYIYQKGLLLTYDPKYRELKKYAVNVEVEHPNFHFYNGKLYILGGSTSREFSSHPVTDLYAIDIRDFSNTRPIEIISL